FRSEWDSDHQDGEENDDPPTAGVDCYDQTGGEKVYDGCVEEKKDNLYFGHSMFFCLSCPTMDEVWCRNGGVGGVPLPRGSDGPRDHQIGGGTPGGVWDDGTLP